MSARLCHYTLPAGVAREVLGADEEVTEALAQLSSDYGLQL